MNYSMEELAPVAGGLIRKYGSYENSSVTYEKAEQLMGAVIYCIREYEAGNDSRLLPEAKVSALAAYQAGYECVMHKAKKAVTLYNQTAVIFHSYRLRCLKDTFRKGLPEFFRHYDPRFHPQDTILTLDYPVLVNLQDLSGIDCIYEYLRCVFLEQKFLAQIPCDEVTECLREYHDRYEELFENVCHIFLLQQAKRRMKNEPVSGRRQPEKIMPEMIDACTHGDTEIRDYLMKDLTELSAWFGVIFPAE
jgi:hypothetical protein